MRNPKDAPSYATTQCYYVPCWSVRNSNEAMCSLSRMKKKIKSAHVTARESVVLHIPPFIYMMNRGYSS